MGHFVDVVLVVVHELWASHCLQILFFVGVELLSIWWAIKIGFKLGSAFTADVLIDAAKESGADPVKFMESVKRRMEK